MNTVEMYSKRIGPFNGSPGGFGMIHDSTKSPAYMMPSAIMPRLGMMPASPPMMGMSPASSTSTFASPPPHLATPSPQAMHSPEGKNDPPKRLRYWLVDMINSGTISELRWEDEGKTIFRIPWKHAGKNNWKEEDCRIFKAWAEHRGKYKEGVDKFDPATWKTRLRCALNKLPDIKELRDRSQLEGTDPYRVYQLLPEPDKSENGMRYDNHSNVAQYNQYHRQPEGKAPTMEFSQLHVGQDFQKQYEDSKIAIKPPEDIPESDYDLQDHSIKTRPPVQDHMDQMMRGHNYNERRDDRRTFAGNQHAMNRDYQMQNTPQLDKSPLGFHGMASPVGSESSQGNAHMEPEPSNYFMPQPPPSQMISHSGASPAPYEMNVYIRYKGMNIMSHHVTNQAGCRIHFGNFGLQQLATVTQELPSHLFGPQNLFQIELVGCEHYATADKQVSLTNHLLKNIQRGLILSYSPDGSIVAKRLCQSRVFYLSPESTSKEPEKLERNRVTKLFDYSSFCNHLKRYAAEQCSSPPSMEIKMSFGQSWSMKNPLEKNLISVVIVPCAAAFLLQKVRERNATLTSIDNSLQTSGPCSDDILVERVTRDSEECVDELISKMMNSYSEDDYPYPVFGQTGMQKDPYDYKPQIYQPTAMDMDTAFKVN